MKKNIILFYLLTIIFVFISSLLWEFLLEPIFPLQSKTSYSLESTTEKWEYVWTVFLFSATALILPTFIALKIEKKRQSTLESLNELQRRTAGLLEERTIQLNSVQAELDDEKLKQSTPEKNNDTSHLTLKSLIDSISDSIMVIDRNYEIRLLNKTAKDIHLNGFPPAGPLRCHKLSHDSDVPCTGPEHECPFKIIMETGESCTVLHYHFDNKGNRVPFEIQASPLRNDKGDIIGIVEISRDVSTRLAMEKKQKEADARLLNLQREQSIATLAGGLAHEFNNILTSILGNAELLSVRLDTNDMNLNQVEAIIDGSAHLADLTKQLLAYAKSGKYLNKSIIIDALIYDTLQLIHTERFVGIEVELELEDSVWPVLGDPAQISQLMMNIIINAFEALENKKGKLIIRTANMTKAEKWECNDMTTHPPGDYVLVSVTNTGSIIAEEMLDKIFDPFFSTKFTGRGMGLAAAKGIVENHNGCISVESGSNLTTFKVLLPREVSDSEIVNMDKPAEDIQNLKVLVVDDEHQVLLTIKNLLEHHGCNVLCADKGREAIEIIKRHKKDLDLVILDIQMPDMGGDKVYTELKKISPGLRVLISSGYEEFTALKNITLSLRDKFIKKPFRMTDLMLKIKEVIVQE